MEGCDKTGKSTLAKELAARTGMEIRHNGVPSGNWYEQLLVQIEAAKQSPKGIIFDRFHWGDSVYAGITTPKALLTDEQFLEIEDKLKEAGTMVIYCSTNMTAIFKKFAEDGEKLIVAEDIPNILKGYRRILYATVLDVKMHDYINKPYEYQE